MATITAVHATPVSIPLETPYRWAAGIFPGFSRTIVEVESSEGPVGIGEVGSAADARIIEEPLGPRLAGADPLDHANCERRALPSSPDTGVANAAYLQVAAGESLSEPSQTLLRWHADDVIAEGPFRPERGVLAVPPEPGLGVTLDEKALARCHRRFLDEGPYDHYSYRE